MHTKRSMFVVAITAALLAMPAVARTSYQGEFQRSYDVSGQASLEVLTRSGDVTVHAGPAGKISVTGRIHVEDRWLSGGRKDSVAELEKNPPIRQDGSNVKIDYVGYREISIDYEITAPADTKLRIETGSGNQTIDGLKGGMQGHSGSGDVRLDNVGGDVRAETGSGNIKGRNVTGPFDVHAGSGDIRIEETGAGDIRATTGSGNVEVSGVNGGARAETGSGNVELQGTPTGSWYVKTSSGNAEVRLPENAAFDLDVSTGSGTIDVGHLLTTTIQGRVQSPSKNISGKVRGGGPVITVHTGSGDIRIR
jgi:DUF4097 and DUF4098 domain-containing protein YvlB